MVLTACNCAVEIKQNNNKNRNKRKITGKEQKTKKKYSESLLDCCTSTRVISKPDFKHSICVPFSFSQLHIKFIHYSSIPFIV